ncbi:hypothetical protein G7Y79_00052g087380 [Physcia stellaris]|nr:hypothetical protein G7Y79_00052g087380 [Physcia stellaris]
MESNQTKLESPVAPETPTSVDFPGKKIRKRNKPSLSCEACTVKKTKCDRGRPHCLACLKRRSSCQYSQLADLIEESHRALGIESPRKKPKQQQAGTADPATIHISQDGSRPAERIQSRSSTGSSPILLSNMPFSHPTASNLFKAEHPFSNYWTLAGGLAEVVGVLPSKDQSDILIAKYFDVVDPIYPMIDQAMFRQDYEQVWSMPPSERKHTDGSLIALIFVMLAMGTQFVPLPSPDQKEQTAEFYVSASHQALRMSSYLSRPSLRSIETMVLITYFLMNDNHSSDAYCFAGILIRQAYALGLNRDPSLVVPNAYPPEMQQRRKLWQAVFLQDTFFTIILKLPPTATHTDVRLEDLDERDQDPSKNDGANDISYIRSFWTLCNICQSNLCTPRSLSLPISSTAEARTRLVTDFDRIYSSFPLPYRTFNEAAVCDLARRSKRLARQTLFLNSNYYHCLMLVYADENEEMTLDLEGTLNSAHEAVNSFFLLHTLFEDEARVWFHFQHRAFSEALVLAELIKSKPKGFSSMDPLYMRAKNDLLRMIGILQLSSETDVVSRTRVGVLSN